MRVVTDGTSPHIDRSMDIFLGSPVLLLLDMTCITGLGLRLFDSVARLGIRLMTAQTGPDRDRPMDIRV